MDGAHPAVPSFPVMVVIPAKVPVVNGGMVVCIRTLTASNGQSATSAINSADALAVRYREVFQRRALSSPTMSL